MSFICFVVFATTALAQTANAINIQDTRAVNDLPNFFGHGIRADFKQIGTIGVPGQGYYGTNITIGQWDDWNNSGGKNHQLNFNDGGFFYRSAYPMDPQWGTWRQVLMTSENGNVGIGTNNPSEKLSILGSISKLTFTGIDGTFDNVIKYGYKFDLESGTSNANRWHGIDATITAGNANDNKVKFRLYPGGFSNAIPVDVLTLQGNGNVGIGTTSPAHKLDVIGTIRSREVKVDMNGADFVFEDKYPLMPLTELEAYVKKNKHLPEIASAKEMQEQGSNLGDLNTKLLQKIEELTLYVIEQQKMITQQANELESHKVMLAKIDQMEKTLAKMNTANEK